MKESPSSVHPRGPELALPRIGVLVALLLLTLLLLTQGCAPFSDPGDSSSTVTTKTSAITQAAVSSSDAARGLSIAEVDDSLLVGNFAVCSNCHALLDAQAAANPALTGAFSHAAHLSKGATCADCHPVPTHTTDAVRTPSMQMCFGCHSQVKPSAPTGKCSACHPTTFPLTPSSHRDPRWNPPPRELDAIQAAHPEAAAKAKRECELCHAPTFCKDCHKVDMPHAEKWLDEHPDAAEKIVGAVCRRCHPGSQSCQVCHHPGYKPGGTPWWELHTSVVRNNGSLSCLNCHSTLTCAHCHTTGEYKAF